MCVLRVLSKICLSGHRSSAPFTRVLQAKVVSNTDIAPSIGVILERAPNLEIESALLPAVTRFPEEAMITTNSYTSASISIGIVLTARRSWRGHPASFGSSAERSLKVLRYDGRPNVVPHAGGHKRLISTGRFRGL